MIDDQQLAIITLITVLHYDDEEEKNRTDEEEKKKRFMRHALPSISYTTPGSTCIYVVQTGQAWPPLC